MLLPVSSGATSALWCQISASSILRAWLPQLGLKVLVHVMCSVRARPRGLLANNTILVGKLTPTLHLFGKALEQPSSIADTLHRAGTSNV